MFLHYYDETKRRISIEIVDWDSAHSVANMLCNAPIDLDYIYYEDVNECGVFNLRTFEKC